MHDRDVLHEDNHLLVVNKPAGVATMGTAEGEPTVARAAAEYLKIKYNKPGNAFVGVVSRIDRLVSGVLVFAKTSKAASRLSDQIRRKVTTKRYLAWVDGDATHWHNDDTAAHEGLAGSVLLEDTLVKNEARQRMEIASQHERKNGQLAQMRVRTHELVGSRSLVEVELITGRKHQIRVQLSSHGHPVVGDSKYGSRGKFKTTSSLPGIALHCRMTKIEHPTTREQLCFVASPGSNWRPLGEPALRAVERVLAASSLEK